MLARGKEGGSVSVGMAVEVMRLGGWSWGCELVSMGSSGGDEGGWGAEKRWIKNRLCWRAETVHKYMCHLLHLLKQCVYHVGHQMNIGAVKRGCGEGDARTALTTGNIRAESKCADLNSTC